MKFNTQTIQLSTQITKDSGAIVTQLELTACDVPDEVVAAALLSGQSPRVRIQNGYRQNGIPKTAKMTWAEFVTPGRAPKVIVPETPEQIAARAKADPEYLAALLDKLGLELPSEEQKSE